MTARSMLRQAVRPTAVVGAALVPIILVAGPAFAADDGEVSGSGLSALQTLGIFVGIPLAAYLLIVFLVLLPSLVRGPRYRPGRAWTAQPVWFSGPDEPTAALAAVDTDAAKSVVGGGASASW